MKPRKFYCRRQAWPAPVRNCWRPWTDADMAEIARLRGEGFRLREIAVFLGRSLNAVEHQLRRERIRENLHRSSL